LGRRISKTINGQVTQFIYDGNDIVQETGGSPLSVRYLRTLKVDEMLGFLRQDGAYFSIYDGLGSALTLTDQAGSPTVQYSYEPFGKTQSSNIAFANSFQFAGRENDGTGLYSYRARYYHPKLQRFITQDPAGLLGGDVNLYGYVRNRPLKFTDALGLKPLPQCAQQKLQPFFPDLDLTKIDIHTKGLPWYVLDPDVQAYTNQNDIYFKQEAYDPTSSKGLALIGHELRHSQQYQNTGTTSFRTSYLWQLIMKGYMNIDFEQEAYGYQFTIWPYLSDQFGAMPCSE
jgi:RHS repeat-associated protein